MLPGGITGARDLRVVMFSLSQKSTQPRNLLRQSQVTYTVVRSIFGNCLVVSLI